MKQDEQSEGLPTGPGGYRCRYCSPRVGLALPLPRCVTGYRVSRL